MRTDNKLFNLIKKSMVVIVSVLMIMALVTTISCDTFAAAKDNSKTKAKAKTAAAAAADLNKSVSEVEAGSAIVFSSSTSQVVYSLHPDRKLQPGALTKLMTAMIVIDNMHSTKEYSAKIEVTPEQKSKDDMLPKAGKNITVEKLIEHMLLNNSDVAADMLVKYSSSTPDTFISEMNSKAIAMGLMNTQFTNATGGYSAGQYSSASDLAVITQYALRYEKIMHILEQTRSDVEFDEITSSVKSVIATPDKSSVIQYMGVASHKDMQLVVVMLDVNEKTRQDEAKSLFEYGYKNVSMNSIVPKDKKVGKARVRHGAWTKVSAYTATKGYAYIPPEGSSDLVQTQVVMFDNIKAPLDKGAKVGEYRIYVADELKGTVDLVTHKEINTGWFPSYIYISNLATILICIVILGILYVVFTIFRLRREAKKRKAAKRQARIAELARRQNEIEEDRRRRGWTYHP